MSRIAAPVTWRDADEHRRIIATRFNERLQESSIEVGTYRDLTTGSPSSVTFEGIPEWAAAFALPLVGVSLSGTNELYARVGDASGIATTGYSGIWASHSTMQGALTTEIRLANMSAADVATAVLEGVLADRVTNTWVCTWLTARAGSTNALFHGAVNVALSGPLTSVQVYASGSDTFDTGSGVLTYS
jgi:hypothetical protein